MANNQNTLDDIIETEELRAFANMMKEAAQGTGNGLLINLIEGALNFGTEAQTEENAEQDSAKDEWELVLHDDTVHTRGEVVETLVETLGYPVGAAVDATDQIEATGMRAIAVGSREDILQAFYDLNDESFVVGLAKRS